MSALFSISLWALFSFLQRWLCVQGSVPCPICMYWCWKQWPMKLWHTPSITGRTAPVYTLRRMLVFSPHDVPVSFFRRLRFVMDLAAVASMCGFHVMRVSRVAQRNFGFSTCSTTASFSFSPTLSLVLESDNRIVCVLLQLISMNHPSAQELITLTVFYIETEAVHTARSSA